MNRYDDQGNQIKDPKINQHSYYTWFLMKKLKPYNGQHTAIHWKCSLINVAGLPICLHVKEWKQDHTCHSAKTPTFKWMKDINIKPDSLHRKENKLGSTIEWFGTEDNFQNRTPMTQALKSQLDKWKLIKLQGLCKLKDTVSRIKW